MSDPDKQPGKVEPKDIKPANENAPPADETAVPAAANNNNEASEPKASITPAVDLPKKDPVVPAAIVPSAPAAEVPAAEAPAAEVPAAEAPAAEAPAAEVPPANDNATVEAPAATAEAAAPVADAPKKGKGFLKKAFTFAAKMAAGAATSAVLKTATVAGLGMTAAPAWATIVVAGLVAGVGTAFLHDSISRHEQKKKGVELAPYFSKAHGKQLTKNLAISTVAAVAGSMLYLGFHEGIIQGWWNHLMGHTPAVAPVAPAVVPVVAQPAAPVVAPVAPPVEHLAAPPVVVAPVHCATPIEQFGDLVKGHHVSAQVQQALHRAASGNARVHAQGLKDLAYYAQNGFGGVPKDHNVALELFKQAADGGNVQSKVDMLYLQHYGLDGVSADKAASLSTMSDIHTAKAAEFVKAWGGAGKHLKHVDFDTKSILKGMKVGCAA